VQVLNIELNNKYSTMKIITINTKINEYYFFRSKTTDDDNSR